uniref:Hydroxyproline-rich glycoprotein family protein n=1 Tax=Steinernema glaseri TaxID=37863 RepID=A0A1I8A229_9BILA
MAAVPAILPLEDDAPPRPVFRIVHRPSPPPKKKAPKRKLVEQRVPDLVNTPVLAPEPAALTPQVDGPLKLLQTPSPSTGSSSFVPDWSTPLGVVAHRNALRPSALPTFGHLSFFSPDLGGEPYDGQVLPTPPRVERHQLTPLLPPPVVEATPPQPPAPSSGMQAWCEKVVNDWMSENVLGGMDVSQWQFKISVSPKHPDKPVCFEVCDEEQNILCVFHKAREEPTPLPLHMKSWTPLRPPNRQLLATPKAQAPPDQYQSTPLAPGQKLSRNFPNTLEETPSFEWEVVGLLDEMDVPEVGPCTFVDWEVSWAAERHFSSTNKVLENWDRNKNSKPRIVDIRYKTEEELKPKAGRPSRSATRKKEEKPNNDSDVVYCEMRAGKKTSLHTLKSVIARRGTFHKARVFELLERKMVDYMINVDDEF